MSFYNPDKLKKMVTHLATYLCIRNNINVCNMLLICVGNHNKRCLKNYTNWWLTIYNASYYLYTCLHFIVEKYPHLIERFLLPVPAILFQMLLNGKCFSFPVLSIFAVLSRFEWLTNFNKNYILKYRDNFNLYRCHLLKSSS